jgi:ubiquinone/menaquinone biosynthesis C-methylase UbiE
MHGITQQTKETYNKISSDYSSKINKLISDSWVGEFEKNLLNKFLLMIKISKPKVLDIGCGNGKDTYFFQQKGCSAVGIDFSEGMLKEAQNLFAHCKFHQMDMRNLEFSNDLFDGIWANGCIYHVSKKDFVKVLKEVIRVLKSSGIFSFNFKIGTSEKIEKNPQSYEGNPRFYAYYTIEEMKKILEQVGFEIIKIKPYPKKIFNEQIVHFWSKKP